MRVTAVSPGIGQHCGVVSVERAEKIMAEFDVRARRWPVEFSYAAQSQRLEPGATTEDICTALEQLPKPTIYLIDVSLVGLETVQQIDRLAVPILISNSVGKPRKSGGALHVAHSDIMSALTGSINGGRIRIDKALAEQLKALERPPIEDLAAKSRYARKARTDDLVTSAGLAVWWASRRPATVPQPPPPIIPVIPRGPATFNEHLAVYDRERGERRI